MVQQYTLNAFETQKSFISLLGWSSRKQRCQDCPERAIMVKKSCLHLNALRL